MSLTAILLVIAAAVIHAGWNALSKSQHPTSSFFLLATLTGAGILSPVLAWNGQALPNIPLRVWGLLAGTGLCMAVYYAALAGAYRAGNISIAYPLARASPLIVVSIVAFVLGRGSQITAACLAGILLVVSGCFLLPMQHVRDFRLRNYRNATCGLALLAAFGTAGYTVLDDEALRLLRHVLAPAGFSTVRVTLLYASLESWSCTLWMALAIAAIPAARTGLFRELRARAVPAAITGVAIWACYVLILISLAFVVNVSYVAAFRQLSIPLGVAFGLLVLKEPAHRPKLAGVAMVFAGLLLVALG